MLLIHFYFYCYAAFEEWGLTAAFAKKILLNISATGIFKHPLYTKLFSLALLLISIIGVKGKKDEKILIQPIIVYLVTGTIIYFTSLFLFYFNLPAAPLAVIYILLSSLGFALILAGGARLSRLISIQLNKDIFNKENETFPQEERLLENEYSVNIPAKYNYKGRVRNMWINIINGARMVLILGSPGAGKTYFLIRNIIKQKIENKQFPGMLVYDFKYDDLAKITYNSWRNAKHKYKIPPKFYIINFDEPINRCNPLEPSTMRDITDATESSRTILLD